MTICRIALIVFAGIYLGNCNAASLTFAVTEAPSLTTVAGTEAPSLTSLVQRADSIPQQILDTEKKILAALKSVIGSNGYNPALRTTGSSSGRTASFLPSVN